MRFYAAIFVAAPVVHAHLFSPIWHNLVPGLSIRADIAAVTVTFTPVVTTTPTTTVTPTSTIRLIDTTTTTVISTVTVTSIASSTTPSPTSTSTIISSSTTSSGINSLTTSTSISTVTSSTSRSGTTTTSTANSATSITRPYCAIVLSDPPEPQVYYNNFVGVGYRTNPATNPANDLNHPALSTSFNATLSVCDAMHMCANFAAAAIPSPYYSFDAYRLRSTQEWKCVTFWGASTVAAHSFVDADVQEDYGFTPRCLGKAPSAIFQDDILIDRDHGQWRAANFVPRQFEIAAAQQDLYAWYSEITNDSSWHGSSSCQNLSK